jgi:hypothetical protein
MWRLADCCRQVPVLHRDPLDLPVPHADLHGALESRFGAFWLLGAVQAAFVTSIQG